MRIVIFCHSLLSDWNHGNAHFLRGIGTELIARGHDVQFYEPINAWSLRNLISECGTQPLLDFHAAYPALSSIRYDPERQDLDQALEGADLVLVHEWNSHDLVKRIGAHRARARNYRLLFHDTHHRAATDADSMAAYDLSHYDGVLAFGAVIRDLYIKRGWIGCAWTWHEAADTRVFRPQARERVEGDLVWIGNWGDEERSEELRNFVLKPARSLKLKARLYGVRYPDDAQRALAAYGVEYAGWLANFRVPEVYAQFRVTVHVPRRPYARALPGIPTIRVFEALACGIPLVCAPWRDSEGLFAPGADFLTARNGAEMRRHLRALVNDSDMRQAIAQRGLETIRSRHTCAHRVDELLAIHAELTASREAA
ncbi:MAG TPA: glycosyltransferase [Burkholderiales bacterium]|nr:glycosyltransferase [Burkholderiales bacterium]